MFALTLVLELAAPAEATPATGAALVDAVTQPDDERAHPEALQAITFTTMLLDAASLGAMVAGGALVVNE